MQTQKNDQMTVTITAHADQRIAQRGICPAALSLVILYGIDAPAGNGCKARELRLSHFSELHELGFAVTTIEKALRIRAILSREEELLTCYQRNPEKNARQPRSRKVRSSLRNGMG
ncbi:MAG: hypothetical protein JXR14_02385 [Paracoccaceae bacterium]